MTASLSAENAHPIPELLPAPVLAQFHEGLANPHWMTRRNAGGVSQVLAPEAHGDMTGRVCDYFSHPALLDVAQRFGRQPLSHFVGTVVRPAAGNGFSVGHAEFPLALVVNLSSSRLTGWALNPGDGLLLCLVPDRYFSWPDPKIDGCIVEGYFVST